MCVCVVFVMVFGKELLAVVNKYLPDILADNTYGNIIVYCGRRDTTESVASFLRTAVAASPMLSNQQQPHKDFV